MKYSALLVDGSNMYASLKALGYTADYQKLFDAFAVHKAYYFTAIAPQTEQSTIRPMVDWLEYNRWTVIQKPTREFTDENGATKIKGNMDIEIATVAFELAPHCHTLYLLSGDGDFRFMIEALQRQYAVRVVVISTIRTKPSMCADSLRRQADEFIDLSDLRDKIARRDDGPRRSMFPPRG